eukprot:jgi/Galph1/4414/GphlegSOOS_G3104.1
MLKPVQELLNTLLHGRNEKRNTEQSHKSVTRCVKQLRCLLFAEPTEQLIGSSFETASNPELGRQTKDEEETFSWGCVIRDLVDITEHYCSVSRERNKPSPIIYELSELLRMVVRTVLETFFANRSNESTDWPVHDEYILNALRFSFASLKDNSRRSIHSDMWCLARDIFNYPCFVHTVGQKLVIKWYQLAFDALDSLESVEVSIQRSRVSAITSILESLVSKSKAVEFVTSEYLYQMIQISLRYLESHQNRSTTESDALYCPLLCIFYILLKRCSDITNEVLLSVEVVSTPIAMTLMREKRGHYVSIGYLVLIFRLLHAERVTAMKIHFHQHEFLRLIQNPGCSFETLEYLSHSTDIMHILRIWDEGIVPFEIAIRMLSYKLQCHYIVVKELKADHSLLHSICSMLETSTSRRATFENPSQLIGMISECCFQLIWCVSLDNETFLVKNTFGIVTLISRFLGEEHLSNSVSALHIYILRTICVFLHSVTKDPCGCLPEHEAFLNSVFTWIESNEMKLDFEAELSFLSHFVTCFDRSIFPETWRRLFRKFLSGSRDAIFCRLLSELLTAMLSRNFKPSLASSPWQCQLCLRYSQSPSSFAACLEVIESRHDSTTRFLSFLNQKREKRSKFSKETIMLFSPISGTQKKLDISLLRHVLKNIQETISSDNVFRVAYLLSHCLWIFNELLDLSRDACDDTKEVFELLFTQFLRAAEADKFSASQSGLSLQDIQAFGGFSGCILSFAEKIIPNSNIKVQLKQLLHESLRKWSQILDTVTVPSRNFQLSVPKKRRISGICALQEQPSLSEEDFFLQVAAFLHGDLYSFNEFNCNEFFSGLLKETVFLIGCQEIFSEYSYSVLFDRYWDFDNDMFQKPSLCVRRCGLCYLYCHFLALSNEEVRSVCLEWMSKLLRYVIDVMSTSASRFYSRCGLISFYLLLLSLKVIFEKLVKIDSEFSLSLYSKFLDDVLQFLRNIYSKVPCFQRNVFLGPLLEIWEWIGVVIFRTELGKELADSHFEYLRLLWDWLNEGSLTCCTFHLFSFINFCSMQSTQVAEYLFLCALCVIERQVASINLISPFIYSVCKVSRICLVRCCCLLCQLAKSTSLTAELSLLLDNIAKLNRYYNLRHMFLDLFWQLFQHWLQVLGNELQNFPIEIFGYSNSSLLFFLVTYFFSLSFEELDLYTPVGIELSKKAAQLHLNQTRNFSLYQQYEKEFMLLQIVEIHIRQDEIFSSKCSSRRDHSFVKSLLTKDYLAFFKSLQSSGKQKKKLHDDGFCFAVVLEFRYFCCHSTCIMNDIELSCLLEAFFSINGISKDIILILLHTLLHIRDKKALDRFGQVIDRIVNMILKERTCWKANEFSTFLLISGIFNQLYSLALTSRLFYETFDKAYREIPSGFLLNLEPPPFIQDFLQGYYETYYSAFFHTFPTFNDQLKFFVHLLSRRDSFSTLHVVGRLQLLKRILEEQPRESFLPNEKQHEIMQQLTKCSAYLLYLIKNWLPTIQNTELAPFGRSDIYRIIEDCFVYLFDATIHPTGIGCSEVEFSFGIPSLITMTSLSDCIDALVQLTMKVFLSGDFLQWTSALHTLHILKQANEKLLCQRINTIFHSSNILSKASACILERWEPIFKCDVFKNVPDLVTLFNGFPYDDEFLWIRQLCYCLLKQVNNEESLLQYFGGLCLVNTEIAAFLLPLVLTEISVVCTVDKWKHVRNGLCYILENTSLPYYATIMLIESFDFLRAQWSVGGIFFSDRSTRNLRNKTRDILGSSQCFVLAKAAFRIQKFATAFFYTELSLAASNSIVQCFQSTWEETNATQCPKDHLILLFQSSLGLNDADLNESFPILTNDLDLLSSLDVYSLANLAIRNRNFDGALTYLNHFLQIDNPLHSNERDLRQHAVRGLYNILLSTGQNYLAELVYGRENLEANQANADCLHNAVAKLGQWQHLHAAQSAANDMLFLSHHDKKIFEKLLTDNVDKVGNDFYNGRLKTWSVFRNCTWETSKLFSQAIEGIRLVSYSIEMGQGVAKIDADNFFVETFYCHDEPLSDGFLNICHLRNLCYLNLERNKFTELSIYFAKYMNFLRTTQQSLTKIEGVFYDFLKTAKASNIYCSSETSDWVNMDIRTRLFMSVMSLEKAKILYDKKEFDSAIYSVSQLHNNFSFAEFKCDSSPQEYTSVEEKMLLQLYVHSCLVLGKWLHETHSEAPLKVYETYLIHAKNICMRFQTLFELRCHSSYTLAVFADEMLSKIEHHQLSSESRFVKLLDMEKEWELEQCNELLKHPSVNKSQRDELLKYIRSLQKEIEQCKTVNNEREEETMTWLKNALENYSNALLYGSRYDLFSTFRFTDLWMKHSDKMNINEHVCKLLLGDDSNVFIIKFLPLMYQFASRLSSKETAFHQAIFHLIFEMAKRHPHDCLWQLLALTNGNRVPSTKKGKERFSVEMDKIAAAENILKLLEYYHGNLVQQTKYLSDSYIELSEETFESKCESSIKSLCLSGIRDSPVRVVTCSDTCQSSVNAKHFPTIVAFKDQVQLAGGINRPKIVVCLGSDGNEYKQLVKGSDDLRQDAVMEQLFKISNELLYMKHSARVRRLHMRTYKVLPLSPCAGVLEWVDNTVPLGHYLVGPTGSENDSAHCRHHPEDWLSIQCRRKLRDAPADTKLCAFREICSHFQPVLHLFFLERFFVPSECLKNRLVYARSVATSSIIGYIIGLGDRHCANILLDTRSAEVIHIDLGVAFEQGRLLRTPETVPFRLTRDIVDGMGSHGVEGAFRNSCEVTLKVLQEYQDILLTVIKVFLHDPLFRWALSPLTVLTRQNKKLAETLLGNSRTTIRHLREESAVDDDRVKGNSHAARALLRVQEKLSGQLDKEPVDVRTHVRRLINDARNPELLCKMFEGWAPWV